MSDSNMLEVEVPNLDVAITTTEEYVQIDVGFEGGQVAAAVSFPNTGQVDMEELESLLQLAPQTILAAIEALEAQQ